MRKSIITFILLCLTLSGFAQQSAEETNFVNKINGIEKTISEAREKKDYKQAERIWLEALNTCNKLSQELRKKYEYLKGHIYYDITCYQALQGKKKEAVKSFAICYENGWNNYSHAKRDTDLDNIRTNKPKNIT